MKTINKYDLIMFDMDGTFMDSRQFHTKVFHRFINEYVKPVEITEVAEAMGNTVRDIFENLGVPHNEISAIIDALQEFCKCRVDDLALRIKAGEGIGEVLDTIRSLGIKTALVTNSIDTVVNRMLDTHGLLDKFDYISGADYHSMDKTDRCKQVAGLFAARHILYVGDTESDIILAKRLDYDSCFAKTEISWYKDADYIINILKPTYVINSLYELIDIIR
jgi:phosphoglycolate phosphatase-like HAD superfamily hydrolase